METMQRLGKIPREPDREVEGRNILDIYEKRGWNGACSGKIGIVYTNPGEEVKEIFIDVSDIRNILRQYNFKAAQARTCFYVYSMKNRKGKEMIRASYQRNYMSKVKEESNENSHNEAGKAG
jgi:hypothetical protein